MKQYLLSILLLTLATITKGQQDSSNSLQPITHRWIAALETDKLFLLNQNDGPGSDDFRRTVMPSIGYGVTRNLVVGIGFPLSYSSRSGTYYSSAGMPGGGGTFATITTPAQVGVSPFVQLYLGQGRLKPYVGAGFQYTYQLLGFSVREISLYRKQEGHSMEGRAFVGLTYFVLPRFGIDTQLRYGWQGGEHPYFVFPNLLTSGGYSSTYSYTGQTLSANIGIRYILTTGK
jgi:hypothetical protein